MRSFMVQFLLSRSCTLIDQNFSSVSSRGPYFGKAPFSLKKTIFLIG